jgi:DNA-binding MarR family transcriptional regulator
MIKKLEDEQGWIKTDTNFDDQRSKWIHLTDEAVQMMEEVTQSVHATSSDYRKAI